MTAPTLKLVEVHCRKVTPYSSFALEAWGTCELSRKSRSVLDLGQKCWFMSSFEAATDWWIAMEPPKNKAGTNQIGELNKNNNCPPLWLPFRKIQHGLLRKEIEVPFLFLNPPRLATPGQSSGAAPAGGPPPSRWCKPHPPGPECCAAPRTAAWARCPSPCPA